MFSVPAVGQSDKKLNPLVREVVISVAKPWESVSVEILLICDQHLTIRLTVATLEREISIFYLFQN